MRVFRCAGLALLLAAVTGVAASADALYLSQGAAQPVEPSQATPAQPSAGLEPAAPPAGAALPLAPNTRLPVLPGAAVWVDAQGPLAPTVAGLTRNAIRNARILVFRPKGDALSWSELVRAYTAPELISPEPEAVREPFAATSTRPTGREETRVYQTPQKDERLVLGMIIDTQTRKQQVYAVLFTGTLDGPQATAQARDTVNRLTTLLFTPPAPTGAMLAQQATLGPADLRRSLEAIERDPEIPARVKQMARSVIPQATSVRLSVWRTRGVLSDEQLTVFYTRAGETRGWGAPLFQDRSQAGRPVLLFQQPHNDGLLMVRAEPTARSTTPTPVPRPASTTIYLLMFEGSFNAAALPGTPQR